MYEIQCVDFYVVIDTPEKDAYKYYFYRKVEYLSASFQAETLFWRF